MVICGSILTSAWASLPLVQAPSIITQVLAHPREAGVLTQTKASQCWANDTNIPICYAPGGLEITNGDEDRTSVICY